MNQRGFVLPFIERMFGALRVALLVASFVSHRFWKGAVDDLATFRAVRDFIDVDRGIGRTGRRTIK